MTKTKTYKQLQDEAELLGIKQNQSTEKLVAAIAEATSVLGVTKLMSLNAALDSQNKELVRALEGKPVPTASIPSDIDDIVAKIDELHEAQMADKEVYTTPYLTGMANNTLVVRAIVTGESVDEEKFIKPITQVDVGGAKIPTLRERLVKAAGEYVTMASGSPRLRTGLTPEQIEKADEIMVALGGEKGLYVLPKE